MNIYHIIDHSGFGSLHKLLILLCRKYSNNKLFTPYLKDYKLTREMISLINNDDTGIIIVHSTGRSKTIYIDKLKLLFPKKKIYIFMHVSIEYEKHKKRLEFINKLYGICKDMNIVVLTPSKEVTTQYQKMGFVAKTIQIGIMDLLDDYYYKDIGSLKKYYDKFITVCASESPGYYNAKGIHSFVDIMVNLDLAESAIIAGINKFEEGVITTKKFKEKEFLNILCHAKAYVQLSTFESYNITAMQAKRFKIPTILLSAEGNESCMNGNTYNNTFDIQKVILDIVNNRYNFDIVEQNYYDSIVRETIDNFHNQLSNLVEEVN